MPDVLSVTMSGIDTDVTAADADEPPSWRVWRSDRGRWWAVQVRGYGGLTLDADDEAGLQERIALVAEQDRLRAA